MAPRKERLELANLRDRVKSSLRWREAEGYDDLWRRMQDLYQGKHLDGMSSHDRVVVNLAFQTANTIHASTTVSYPKIKLYARDPEKNDHAIIAEQVLDYLWKSREIDASKALRAAVKDSIITGLGVVKTGYRFTEKVVERDQADVDAELEAAMAEVEGFAAENPDAARDLPSPDDVTLSIPATEVAVGDDRVFVERVSPFDFVVDPFSTSWEDMGWCAQRTIVPIDQVRRNKSYNSKARRSVKADYIGVPDSLGGGYASDNTHRGQAEPDRCTIWEFYDLRLGQVAVFASVGDGWLVAPRPIPYRVGHPFVPIAAHEVPDRFYPMGDLEAIEPLQHELNRTRTQSVEARKNYARKYLVDEKFLTPEVTNALRSANDGEVVPVSLDRNQGESLADVIAPAPIHQLPADLYAHNDAIASDIFQVSGVSEYQRGGVGTSIRRTATEAAMIQDSVNARLADRLAVIEQAIANIGRNMLYLHAQYMTGQQTARFLGAHGRPIWVPYEQWEIDVEADFVVEGGSTMPKNEGWQQNQAMQLAQAVGPLVGEVIDPGQFAVYMLRAFGINDAERYIMQPEPPPEMGPGEPEGDPLPPGATMPPEMIEQIMASQGGGDMGGGDMSGGMMDGVMLDGMGGELGGLNPEADAEAGVIPPEILAQLLGQLGLSLD